VLVLYAFQGEAQIHRHRGVAVPRRRPERVLSRRATDTEDQMAALEQGALYHVHVVRVPLRTVRLHALQGGLYRRLVRRVDSEPNH